MATVGAKNQPLVQTTDTFNPVSDINTLSNWVASNYANFKVLSGATLHTAVTGADLFAGLVVWETSTGQFWQYDGTSWNLLGLGSAPRLELTRTTSGTGFFANNVITPISGWTTTQNRGGFTESSGTVTVPVSGRYNISGTFPYASSATGYRVYEIACAGSQSQTYRNLWQAAASATGIGTVSMNGVRLTAGDTVKLQGLQNSGGALDLQALAAYPIKLIIEYVGS